MRKHTYSILLPSLFNPSGSTTARAIYSQPPNTREVPPQATYRVSVLEQQRRAMETELQERLQSFHDLPEPAKPQARIDIEALLFALFDLNMSHLESQSKSLRAQLARMESDPNFNSQTSEISDSRILSDKLKQFGLQEKVQTPDRRAALTGTRHRLTGTNFLPNLQVRNLVCFQWSLHSFPSVQIGLVG